MRKKKIRKIIITILIIVVAVLLISKIMTNKKEDVKRLANLYEKLNTSQTIKR